VDHVSDLSEKTETRGLDRAALPASMARLWWCKRLFDVVGALVLLVLTAPLFVLAAIAVRLGSPGPVLFRQRRVADHGRIIELVKFRTFPVSHQDTVWSLSYEDCPLAVGRLLRRASIDELPQLWNVLKGDLSLVGPRPERPQFADQLCEAVPGYAARQRVPAGITGLAQVSGYWGRTSIYERVRCDNAYIERWSPLLDLSIVVRTVGEVVRRAVHPVAEDAQAAAPHPTLVPMRVDAAPALASAPQAS
jgi:lipopolysaccharide/colanic/teichoic acid biosynthesis glycosyltransferase